jgi:hypothetical protein
MSYYIHEDAINVTAKEERERQGGGEGLKKNYLLLGD